MQVFSFMYNIKLTKMCLIYLTMLKYNYKMFDIGKKPA